MRHHPREGTAAGVLSLLVLSGALAAGCGGASGSGDWYYHWSCNGDAECLATNPTGAASGTSNEGPVEVNCTQLLQFAAHFWGSAAFNSCTQSASFDGGGPTITGFAPAAASPGATLTIAGTNLIGGTVTIDGLTAAITSTTATQIVCVVPLMQDFVGPITVTTSKGSATSGASLTVAHAGSVYWSAYNDGSLLSSFVGGIWQVAKSGGTSSVLLPRLDLPSRLAIDGQYLYYTQSAPAAGSTRPGLVGKVELRTGLSTTVGTNPNYADGIAVDASAVYWTESTSTQTGTIVKKRLMGGASPVTVAAQPNGLITCASTYCMRRSNLVLDGTNVYWAQADGVFTAPIAGGSVARLAIRDGSGSTEIAIDSTSVYWLEATTIDTVAKTGGTATPIVTGLTSPAAIVADAANLYWIDGLSLKKMGTSGGPASTIATVYGTCTGMALDSTSVYWIDGMSIRKVGLDGGVPTDLANPVYGPPRSIVVDVP